MSSARAGLGEPLDDGAVLALLRRDRIHVHHRDAKQ
jgi:hypothetical protein